MFLVTRVWLQVFGYTSLVTGVWLQVFGYRCLTPSCLRRRRPAGGDRDFWRWRKEGDHAESYTVTTRMTSALRTGIDQLGERPTEKPGAILTRVRVPGEARDFSPRINFQCKLSYGIFTAPMCSRMYQHLCARTKTTQKNYKKKTHTLATINRW